MFSEPSSRVGLRTERERERERERGSCKGEGGSVEGGGEACPRNLQMKREGFSLNAIKFFHFTASPVDSFSSLGAQSLQRNSVFKMGRQGAWRGGGGGAGRG